jgi:hypothetical protein
VTPPRWPAVLALALGAAPVAGAQTPADTLPARVAERQIEAFNRRDLDGFMALYADDAVVMAFPSGTVMAAGRAAIREHYAAMFRTLPAGFPPVRVEPRVVEGPFVFELEAWDAPPGERNRAVWMYEIRGGLIRRAWTLRM